MPNNKLFPYICNCGIEIKTKDINYTHKKICKMSEKAGKRSREEASVAIVATPDPSEAEKFIAQSLNLIEIGVESSTIVDPLIINKLIKLPAEVKTEVQLLIASELVELTKTLEKRDRLLDLERLLTASRPPPSPQNKSMYDSVKEKAKKKGFFW